MANASEENGKTRIRELAEQAAALVPTKLVQLPLWPDEKRGAPNAILRSAVFAASKPASKRAMHQRVLLPVLPPYAIYYTGPQLYQPDLDVWLELLHRCRLTPLGLSATVTVRSLLRGLGRATGKANYEYTHESAQALTEATLHVVLAGDGVMRRRGTRSGFSGHLVERFKFDTDRQVWMVQFHPDIAAMFAGDDHTWLATSARRTLGKGYLAKWLHGYFSSHREPHPVSVERLRDLSGSSAKQALRDFRRAVRRGLQEVASAESDDGRGFKWRLDADDMVHVAKDQPLTLSTRTLGK